MRRRELLSKTSGACLAPAAIGVVGLATRPSWAVPTIGAPASSPALLRTYLTSLPVALPASLEPGMRLLLKRAPERAYDRRSIAAYAQSGEWLGYLPDCPTHALAALMDQGLELVAEVVTCTKSKRPAVTVDLHRQTAA